MYFGCDVFGKECQFFMRQQQEAINLLSALLCRRMAEPFLVIKSLHLFHVMELYSFVFVAQSLAAPARWTAAAANERELSQQGSTTW